MRAPSAGTSARQFPRGLSAAALSAVTRRPFVLAVCALLVAALLGAAALAPLPFSVAHPGATVDVLGEDEGRPVISVAGDAVRDGAGGAEAGELRMTTIMATSPDASVRLGDLLGAYFSDERAVMPREAVYPVGRTTEQIEQHNTAQMAGSQTAAVRAALAHLGMSEDEVDIELRLENVGGPSAGLLFSLGIVDLLGDDLTGGEVIAGTGTITPEGVVGSVGGVPLKTLAAHRDGATVFLVPADECAEAGGNAPDGLRLIPVRTLGDAVASLTALASGDPAVPSC
jgi:PDZ domain-containing protein